MSAIHKGAISHSLSRLFSYFFFRLLPSVQEHRQLAELHRHKLFLCGLFTKLTLVLTAYPQIREYWFIPFVDVRTSIFNPWGSYLASGGDSLAFPYGIVMYLSYLPLTFLGRTLDHNFSTTSLTTLGFGLTSLLFDYTLLIAIALLARKFSVKLLLATYWCSPLVVYILYIHGQLDILPVLLLILGVCMLQRSLPWISGILLGLAVSAKLSMIVALPFIFIYLCRNPLLRSKLTPLLLAISLTLAIFFIPFLPLHAFEDMVLLTPESSRLFSVFLSYGINQSLFLLPTAYVVTLYLVWRLERITLDLFVISIGIGFFVLLLLLPPAPGWLLWVIPFLVFYQLRSQGDYLLTIIPFYVFYLIYNIIYSSGASFPGLGIYWSQPLSHEFGSDYNWLNSILFTAQQATGMLVCLRMYIYGINRNNYYRRGRHPLVLAIAGDSGVGKGALVSALSRLLGDTSTTYVSEGAYNKRILHDSMPNSKSYLDPHATNLGRLTQDVFALADGKAIWSRLYDHSTGIYSRLQKVFSADFVIVSGLHILSIRRLRQRLDLTIFLDCDNDLRHHWEGKCDIHERYSRSPGTFISEGERLSSFDASIYTQPHFSRLIYRLSCVNPNSPVTVYTSNREPRLKLFVTMDNGFFHEQLVHLLISLCGMHVDIEQSPHLDSVTLCVEGDITGEDVAQIATLLIPNIDDLLPLNPPWDNGTTGLMQLITLVHISDLLHHGAKTAHA